MQINCPELLAAFLAVKCFAKDKANLTIHLKMGSMSVCLEDGGANACLLQRALKPSGYCREGLIVVKNRGFDPSSRLYSRVLSSYARSVVTGHSRWFAVKAGKKNSACSLDCRGCLHF